MKITGHLFKLFAAVMLCVLFNINFAQAQNATLNGIILELSSGSALEGANVVLTNLDDEDVLLGASTDRNGYYTIQRITAGNYKVVVSFLGYISYEDTLIFSANERKTLSTSLETDDVSLGEVIVQQTTGAARIERGVQRITPVEMGRIPAPVAGGDLVSYLQVMPGVVSLGSRGGQIFVRGGTPSENMILVDGALIYKPFHMMSFFSPFPDNLVGSADFYPGGFGAEYHGRVSSVLDIDMKHGDRVNYKASASISPFMGDIMVQGPIEKGLSSFVISAKQSIIEETSEYFMSQEQPLKFGSQFAKFSNIKDNSQCSGMILRTFDEGKIDYDSDETVEWNNLVFGGKCEAVSDEFFSKMTASLSKMDNASIHPERVYESNITQLNADLAISRYTGDIRIDFGVFVKVEWLNYDLAGSVNGLEESENDLLSKGGFIQFSIPIGENFDVEPGINMNDYDSFPWSFEPRLRMSWEPFGEDNGELSGAVGIYRQVIVGITDQRDATGTFVTWTQTPFSDKIPEARHALLGWQQNIGDGGFSYSTEVYYKKIYDTPIALWSTVARFSTDLTLADGEVYGADFRMEYNKGNTYAMVGYGYTNTEYSSSQDLFGYWFGEPLVSYNPAHDRRHQLNALFSRTFGEITAGLRWQYGSGIPYTRPLGFDEIVWFDDGLPDVTNEAGTSRVLIDRPFTGRFPSYHSLDMSLERVFDLAGNSKLTTRIGAINMYDRNNIFYYDLYTQERVDQLPLTAYLSIKIDIE